ncbi:MAG: hypothetical protein DRZ76_02925 [Candidatus Nealsonbacteria bacterium]|nr:MAG: hypothetical protein DRZ76_02925 [Candidatus Nealsonbacteria bacterium]
MYLPKAMVDGVPITDTQTTYYTTPANTRSLIKKATFTNDDASPVTISINVVRSGESVGYANAITKTKTLAAGETWSCADIENHIMEASGFISMVASVTLKIGCRITGFEIT